jgi:hypothetical protein
MPKSAADLGVEWQECRQTISRFDGNLSDTRKYGFTLVTLLLTANALVTTRDPVVDRTAASIVIMALLLVLYLLESYYNDLLMATAKRAAELEGDHPKLITGLLIEVATRQQVKVLIQVVYGLFVAVAGGIALVAVFTAKPFALGGLVALLVAASSVAGAMVFAHQWSRFAPAIMKMVGGLGVNTRG